MSSAPTSNTTSQIADLKLAKGGSERVQWAAKDMPVLRQIRDRFSKDKPLRGQRLAACLHVTCETAVLMETLAAGGAQVALCASNPLSTQDDVAAYLSQQEGIAVYAIHGANHETYYSHIHAALSVQPTMTMDDGADLVTTLHTDPQ